MWIFCKILGPSQNILTLTNVFLVNYIFIFSWLYKIFLKTFVYPYNTNAIKYVSTEFLDKYYSFHHFVWHFWSIFCIMKKAFSEINWGVEKFIGNSQRFYYLLESDIGTYSKLMQSLIGLFKASLFVLPTHFKNVSTYAWPCSRVIDYWIFRSFIAEL